MALQSGKTVISEKNVWGGKVRNYNEVVEYLDGIPYYEYAAASVERMTKLNELFNNPAGQLDIILIAGTNGKSLTAHFATKLFKEEGFRAANVFSSHFLSYNERFVCDDQSVTNKQFADVVNQVINAAQHNDISVTAFEVLTMSGILFALQQGVDALFLETNLGGRWDAANFVSAPLITAVTRVTADHTDVLGESLDDIEREYMGIAKKGVWFVSAEQSKLRLQAMKEKAQAAGAQWSMPVRKLAQLPYIYEQLCGRPASLAERIAQMYVEDIKGKFSPFLRGNLLATRRGQRGRPTLEAKRQAELNPIKTLKGFWAQEFDLLRGRLEVLDKEKPTVLLDEAHNLDALTNTFLAIRLLHYQRPLKGVTVILGVRSIVDRTEVLKSLRYLFKKVSGQVFFVPIEKVDHWAPDESVTAAKALNIKAKAFQTFAQAFEAAKPTVDERQGLLVVAGHPSLITTYWNLKGTKKLS